MLSRNFIHELSHKVRMSHQVITFTGSMIDGLPGIVAALRHEISYPWVRFLRTFSPLIFGRHEGLLCAASCLLQTPNHLTVLALKRMLPRSLSMVRHGKRFCGFLLTHDRSQGEEPALKRIFAMAGTHYGSSAGSRDQQMAPLSCPHPSRPVLPSHGHSWVLSGVGGELRLRRARSP